MVGGKEEMRYLILSIYDDGFTWSININGKKEYSRLCIDEAPLYIQEFCSKYIHDNYSLIDIFRKSKWKKTRSFDLYVICEDGEIIIHENEHRRVARGLKELIIHQKKILDEKVLKHERQRQNRNN